MTLYCYCDRSQKVTFTGRAGGPLIMFSLSPPVAPTSQLSCYQVQALEREMAALKQRLVETSRELQRLRATITKASHAIQAALQVREHLLVVSVAKICSMPTDLSMRVSSTSFTKCGANTVCIMCIYHTHTHTHTACNLRVRPASPARESPLHPPGAAQPGLTATGHSIPTHASVPVPAWGPRHSASQRTGS